MASVQERYLWLGQHRGTFGAPEAFSFFVWPQSIESLMESSVLAPLRARLTPVAREALTTGLTHALDLERVCYSSRCDRRCRLASTVGRPREQGAGAGPAMTVMIPERRRVVISGKVQGIAFLLWIRNVANSLELAGSVRPLEDGRCESVVQGDRQLVKQFVVACKRGPSEASIEAVEHFLEPFDPKQTTFVVYRTPWPSVHRSTG